MAYCENCGRPLAAGARFCEACGTPHTPAGIAQGPVKTCVEQPAAPYAQPAPAPAQAAPAVDWERMQPRSGPAPAGWLIFAAALLVFAVAVMAWTLLLT